jgi:hypothetical protein
MHVMLLGSQGLTLEDINGSAHNEGVKLTAALRGCSLHPGRYATQN